MNTKYTLNGVEPTPQVFRCLCGIKCLTKYDLDVHMRFCDKHKEIAARSREWYVKTRPEGFQ